MIVPFSTYKKNLITFSFPMKHNSFTPPLAVVIKADRPPHHVPYKQNFTKSTSEKEKTMQAN